MSYPLGNPCRYNDVLIRSEFAYDPSIGIQPTDAYTSQSVGTVQLKQCAGKDSSVTLGDFVILTKNVENSETDFSGTVVIVKSILAHYIYKSRECSFETIRLNVTYGA